MSEIFIFFSGAVIGFGVGVLLMCWAFGYGAER
jgi:hypothetical protein